MVLPVRLAPLRDLRYEILEALGLLVVAGTATGGSSTTLVDTGRLTFPNNDDLNGFWVYIHDGTGEGQERLITDFVASTDTITVAPAWGTNAASGSEYIVTRFFSAHEVDRAIDATLARYGSRVAVPWEDHSLGANNIFSDPDAASDISATGRQQNWQFDFWDTQHVPNDWTLTNSNSDEEEAGLLFGGNRRVLKLQNTGSSAGSATISVTNWHKYVGTRVRLWGPVVAGTASRAFIRIDDGVATTDSSDHSGDQSKEMLDTGWHTVSDNATQLVFSYQISSGSQITIYCGPLFPQWEYMIEEYIIPQGFTVLEDVEVEFTYQSAMRDYGKYRLLHPDDWEVLRGPGLDRRVRDDSGRGQDTNLHPRLRLKTRLPAPARLRLRGLGYGQLLAPAATTVGGVGSTNYEGLSPVVAPEFVKAAVMRRLNGRIPEMMRRVSQNELLFDEDRLLRQYTSRMPPHGKRVRTV